MNAQLKHMLRRLGRRLWLTRAAEQAAVTAIAAMLAWSAVALAQLAGDRWLAGAVALAAMPLAGALALAWWRPLRRRLALEPRQLAVPCVVMSAIAAAGGAMVLLDASALVAGLAPGALALAAAVVAGGMEAWANRRQLRLACYLDFKYDLRERVATACELASADGDSPVAALVAGQAAVHLGRAVRQDPGMWNRTRATLGMLALSAVLLAGVLTASHVRSAPRLDDGIAQALRSSAPADRRELAHALRQAAQAIKDNPQLAQQLRQAARPADARELQQLEQLLAELAAQGVDLAALLPPSLQPPQPQSVASGGGDNGAQLPPPPATAQNAYVRVYMPAAPSADKDDQPSAAPTQSFADAWAKAARDSGRRDHLPPRTRKLVADFFGRTPTE